jgi:hypothetical protein
MRNEQRYRHCGRGDRARCRARPAGLLVIVTRRSAAPRAATITPADADGITAPPL